MSKSHSGKYNLLMNYILLAANFLFPLITYPYVTRILGAESLGKVSFAMSISNYFSAIATFGITSYAVRSCAKVRNNRDDLSRTAGEMFTANAFTTMIAVLVFAIAVLVVPNFRLQWKFMLLFGLSVATEFLGIGWFYTATEQFTYITVRGLALKTLSLACIFLFIKDSSDALIYVCIIVFSNICVNLVNFIHSGKSAGIKLMPSSGFFIHYNSTKWFFLQSVALTILSNMDVSMLGFLSTDAQVGNYEVALKLKLLASSLVSALGNVFLPRLSRNYAKNDIEAFKHTVTKSLRYNCVISLPIFGFFLINSDVIISLFCGNEYTYSADILKVLMIAVVLIGISTVTGIQILLSVNKEKGLFVSLLAGSLVNLVLNFGLIPVLHGFGAAITTVCSEAVILIVQLIFIRKIKISLPFFDIMIKPLVGTVFATAAAFISIKLLSTGGIVKLLVPAGCFGIVYVGILLLWKEEILTEMLRLFFRRKNGK